MVNARARLAGLGVRVAKLEQELARQRVEIQGLQHLVSGNGLGQDEGQAPEPLKLLEQRVIGLIDLVSEQAIGTEGDRSGAWERIAAELKEALAGLGLRIETPKGRFNSRTCRAAKVVPAQTEDEHFTVKAVIRPAIVRGESQGGQVIRPAAVVVADTRVHQVEWKQEEREEGEGK